ncbi:unnamed protein product [Peniophora sp. CBMAI 1063]|nr:unnamed protein product [Peniophora sp. CBMAI 1063]
MMSMRQIGQVYLARSRGEDGAVSFSTANRQLHLLLDDQDSALNSTLEGCEAGIDEAMHDILLRDDFLAEPRLEMAFLMANLSILVTVVCANRDVNPASKATLQRIRRRAPTVVQHLWNQRDRLNLCLSADITSYVLSKFQLYLWVYAPSQEDEGTTNLLLQLHCHHALQCFKAETEDDLVLHGAYLRDAIFDATGPDDYLIRLNKELQRPRISRDRLGTCMASVHYLKFLPDLLPYLQKHNLTDSVVRIMEEYWLVGDPLHRLITYGHVAGFIRGIGIGFFISLANGIPPRLNVRGQHVFVFLRRGVLLAIEECAHSAEVPILDLCDNIRDFCTLCRPAWKKAVTQQYLTELHASALEHWWPCLAKLQAGCYRHKDSQAHLALLACWEEAGDALGLSEKEERKRFRREGRVFCFWPECEFNTVRPTSKLSACRGCGEVQYCGKDCQKKDWSCHDTAKVREKRCASQSEGRCERCHPLALPYEDLANGGVFMKDVRTVPPGRGIGGRPVYVCQDGSFQHLLETLTQTISDLPHLLPRTAWDDGAGFNGILRDMLAGDDALAQEEATPSQDGKGAGEVA